MQPQAFGQRNFWHELRPTVWGETVDSAESLGYKKKKKKACDEDCLWFWFYVEADIQLAK